MNIIQLGLYSAFPSDFKRNQNIFLSSLKAAQTLGPVLLYLMDKSVSVWRGMMEKWLEAAVGSRVYLIYLLALK